MSHVNEYDSIFLIHITLYNLQKRLLYPLSFYSSQQPNKIGWGKYCLYFIYHSNFLINGMIGVTDKACGKASAQIQAF